MTETNSTKAILAYSKALKEAISKSVAVGLPKGKATSVIYEDGETVLDVGATHEYGKGNIPMRSFLRTPFIIEESKLRDFIVKQFRLIAAGKPTDKALALIGFFGENIVKEAFTNGGYGTWPDISQYTKDKKKSTQILVDTGILRGSILSEVR